MREGSREPGRGECCFVVEKTFRTRPNQERKNAICIQSIYFGDRALGPDFFGITSLNPGSLASVEPMLGITSLNPGSLASVDPMLGITSLCIDIALGVVLGASPDFNFSATFVIFGSTCSEALFSTQSISAPFGGQRKFFRILPQFTISLIPFAFKPYLAFSTLIAGLRPMTMTTLPIAYIDWRWPHFSHKKSGLEYFGVLHKIQKGVF